MNGPGEAVTGRPRTLRSYVLRGGRITVAQRRALDELWPHHGIDFDGKPLDFTALFGRSAPRILEIGFGDGELLCDLAQKKPENDFIGVEVHEAGVGHCLLLIEKLGLTNVRLISHDAVEVLQRQIPDSSLAKVYLFFPDPWPKKRHHKRRIVQPEFMRLIAAKLQPGGEFRAATDWAPYAAHIEEILATAPGFEPVADPDLLRCTTKFERRGERLGHKVGERVWRRSTAT
ncbi:MAG: tRNA (guanosine(46)-N7)-methyltransferase TrmB [Gammaproteobacteria bacterium]|nr:tRNA (guanosine(46)-N7)-methyltransferase TrmB [Gammaproteobacteria bacterium]